MESKACLESCLSLYISLQPPVFPDASIFGQVIGDGFALAVVGYGIAISLGRIFALKYGYKVDSNQVGRLQMDTEIKRYFSTL